MRLERRGQIPRRLTPVTDWTARELPGGFRAQPKVVDKVAVALAVLWLVGDALYRLLGWLL